MFGRLFRSETQHIPIKVNGSTGHHLGRHMATKRSVGEFNPAWFAGDHSVILGGWSEDPNKKLEASSAAWFLPVD
jgi:hypothetical protein